MGTARLSLVLALVLLVTSLLPARQVLAAGELPPDTFSASASATTTGCVRHIVRRGETLSSIARRYRTTVWNLARLNRIWDVNRIYPGQVLLIFPCVPPPKPPPPPPAPPPPPPPAPPPPAPPFTCAIQPVLGFGRVWTNNPNVRVALGCPTTPETGLTLTAQRFQFGWLWFNHAFTRWELLNSRTQTWALFSDEGSARAAAAGQLGAALTGAFMATGTYQLYDGGGMIWTPATGIIVFFNNGTWRGF